MWTRGTFARSSDTTLPLCITLQSRVVFSLEGPQEFFFLPIPPFFLPGGTYELIVVNQSRITWSWSRVILY